VVLVHDICLFQNNLLCGGPRLCGDDLLEVANGVRGKAFDPDFFAEAVVAVGGLVSWGKGKREGGWEGGYNQITSIIVCLGSAGCWWLFVTL